MFSLTRHRSTGAWVGCGFLIWAFVWDNSRQALGDVTDPILVMPVPRVTKYVEVFVLAVLTVGALTAQQNRRTFWVTGTVFLLLAVILAICSSVVGVLGGYTTAASAVQTTYGYLSPLILALVVGSLGRTIDAPASVLNTFTVLVGANGLVAWYQVAVRGAWGDGVHGAMHDAHVYTNAAWIGVLWALVRLYHGYGPRWRELLLLALLVPTGWAAQHEAGNAVLALVIAGALFALLWRRGWTWRLVGIAGIIASSGLLVSGVIRGDSLAPNIGRLRLIAGNLPALGIVEGYRQVPSVMAGVPHSFLVGTGPGSYGSAPALGAMLAGGQAPPLMERFTAESYRLTYRLNAAAPGLLGSFVQKSTDLTAVVVEFGPPAVLCALSALCLLVLWPSTSAATFSGAERQAVGHWVILSASYLLLLSCWTAFYGWSVAHTSTFAIVASGALLVPSDTRGVTPAQQRESRTP